MININPAIESIFRDMKEVGYRKLKVRSDKQEVRN